MREVYLGRGAAWLSCSRAERLTAGYGDSIVLEDVSLTLDEGDSLALLGRNGVGKSTLLVTLMGFTRLQQGRLALQGSDITRLPAWRRAHAGLGWVPQERYMFPSLTVEEHLTVVERRPGPWNLGRVYKVFPRLEERRRNLRQPAFRRRAADARDRPRADDQSGAAAARRADGRAWPDHRAGTRQA